LEDFVVEEEEESKRNDTSENEKTPVYIKSKQFSVVTRKLWKGKTTSKQYSNEL